MKKKRGPDEKNKKEFQQTEKNIYHHPLVPQRMQCRIWVAAGVAQPTECDVDFWPEKMIPQKNTFSI